MSDALARRLATLEGAESALVVGSGTAAVACTMLALLRSGDHVVASRWLRPELRRFVETALPALGVAVSLVDPEESRGWRRALARTTRALFVETPVLRSTRLIDLRAPRLLAQELGVALVVDATAATPVNFAPLAEGADVVVHDAARFLMDADAGAAGVVAATDSLIEEIRTQMTLWGALPHPAAMADLTHGLDTLDVRVQRQNANAQVLAQGARALPGVSVVHWPGLESHPDAALARTVLRGFGPHLVLDLDTAERAQLAVQRELAGRSADGPRVTHLQPGDAPTQLLVTAGVEPAEAAVAWLAARLA